MKKIDLHLHLTPFQIPKLGKMNLTSGKNMIPHLEELGISKGVLMSSGEKGLPFGTNEANKKICRQFPDRYAWMCSISPKGKTSVYDRLARFQAEGAVGIGELTYNHKLTDPFLQEVFAAAEKLGATVYLPPLSLCGDNAAMIGSQAYYEYQAGNTAGMELNAYATKSILGEAL